MSAPSPTRRAPTPPDPAGEPLHDPLPWAGLTVVLAVAGLLLLMALPTSPQEASARPLRAPEIALRARLAELRGAIADYRADHGSWPGTLPEDGADEPLGPAQRSELFERQLRGITDADGRAVGRRGCGLLFGPYLNGRVPACPINGVRGVRVLGAEERRPLEPDDESAWIYDPANGRLRANASGRLVSGGTRYFDI